jgi:RNA polymerase sigma-70 factor (ECF subfamily)
LFGIAIRVLSDYRRTFRNSHERLDRTRVADRAIDGAPPQDEKLAEAQSRTLLMEALDCLDFDRRVVLVMHDLDEISVPEIAATWGMRRPKGRPRPAWPMGPACGGRRAR